MDTTATTSTNGTFFLILPPRVIAELSRDL
jgi:hypothetical protein